MPIWQLCANLLIPNCLRSNLSYSPLAALELYVKKARNMRITKKTILAIGLIASSLTLNSCDDNDNNEVLQRPTALVTVYPSAPVSYTHLTLPTT